MDENAAIVEAYAYEVYGEPTIKTGDGGDRVTHGGEAPDGRMILCPHFPIFLHFP